MKKENVEFSIDAIDRELLRCLQEDAGLSNQALAERVHISPPTCLRRVRRLYASGLIERQIAIVAPERLAQLMGHGLWVLVEVVLERQSSEHLDAFETLACAQSAVQQCWRVTPGPDFMLVLQVSDMPAYQALVQRLLTQDANVRNVKAFFVTRRAKFTTALAL